MDPSNPFHIQGVVTPPEFTDRADEVRRVCDVLLSPPSKLLVYGDRRVGKTSVLHVARHEAERKGGSVVFADFSTASSVADLANRLLAGAVRGLGRSWADIASDLARRLRVSLRLVHDPASGLAVPALEAEFRDRDLDEQRATLESILNSLEGMAAERGTRLGVVLDEFQEIHRFGGESAEWHLRGIVQEHRQLSYVLAGSRTALIRRMLEKGRAFYKLFDLLSLGPIERDHLARWIDERMRDGGRPCPGVGEACIDVAGPRTRDVVQLARSCWEVLPQLEGSTPAEVVEAAFLRIVVEEDDPNRSWWYSLTPYQQNLLRAVAGAERGLTSRETLGRFGLGHSGSAANAASSFVEGDRLVRVDRPPGYDFDNPFLRGWVIVNALPDMGIHRPATWRAGE
jgi:hypothetical protein